MKLIGWTDCWTSPYGQTSLTDERRRLLVERIRYRHYNFTYEAHQTLPYCAPIYSDNKLCCLTKSQWDDVFAEAYGDEPLGRRLMPLDIIKTTPSDDILYENKKSKAGENNG